MFSVTKVARIQWLVRWGIISALMTDGLQKVSKSALSNRAINIPNLLCIRIEVITAEGFWTLEKARKIRIEMVKVIFYCFYWASGRGE